LSETRFDVVVAGCGPAGNTAAYRLASGGVRVLMIDKETIPRHKVCGGGLSRKTIEELPLSVGPVIEREIDHATIAYRGRDAVVVEEPGIGAMVQRDRFDGFMTERAVASGATLWDRCTLDRCDPTDDGVVVGTAQGMVRARVLIAADGVYSTVRRQLLPSARPLLVPAIEALLAPRPGMLELLGSGCVFDLGAISAGYAWVFPKSDHLNVGLYRFHKRRDNLGMKRLLEEFIAGTKLLREPAALKVKAYSIPVKPVSSRLARGRVLLAGDAAGLGEAFYGEGIYYAVRSGNLAADAVLDYLARGASLASYDRALRGLRRSLAYSRATARLFYLSPRLAFRYAVRNRTVGRLFTGVIAGSVTPARCFWGFLLRAPYWLAARRMPAVKSPLFD
jgi:geranylgeranyl reductase family protein